MKRKMSGNWPLCHPRHSWAVGVGSVCLILILLLLCAAGTARAQEAYTVVLRGKQIEISPIFTLSDGWITPITLVSTSSLPAGLAAEIKIAIVVSGKRTGEPATLATFMVKVEDSSTPAKGMEGKINFKNLNVPKGKQIEISPIFTPRDGWKTRFKVTFTPNLPAGLTAEIKIAIAVSGKPTGAGKLLTTAEFKLQDSSTPAKKVKRSLNFYVSGSRYRASVQLQDAGGVLNATITKMFIIDSGAHSTTVSRKDAKAFKLLKANDRDNGLAAGTSRIGGIGGNWFSASLSKEIKIKAKGKRADGTDQDPSPKAVDKLCVTYPTRGNPDIKINLLGTNFINRTQSHSLTLDPRGHASFFDPLLKPPKPPKKPKKCRRVVPTTPESRKPNPGGEGRRLINAELNGIPAAFYVVTGSPHTIIGESLAGQIGLRPIGLVDMNEEDPLSAGILFLDGFFENAEPGKLSLAVVESFAIPAIDPGPDGIVYTSDDASVTIEFKDAPVLINPFGVDQNVLGTNLLFLDDESSTTLDFEADLIGFGCDERLLPPGLVSIAHPDIKYSSLAEALQGGTRVQIRSPEGGHLGQTLDIIITNTKTVPIKVTVKRGERLLNKSRERQNLEITKSKRIKLEPFKEATIKAWTVCMDYKKGSPAPGDIFDVAKPKKKKNEGSAQGMWGTYQPLDEIAQYVEIGGVRGFGLRSCTLLTTGLKGYSSNPGEMPKKTRNPEDEWVEAAHSLILLEEKAEELGMLDSGELQHAVWHITDNLPVEQGSSTDEFMKKAGVDSQRTFTYPHLVNPRRSEIETGYIAELIDGDYELQLLWSLWRKLFTLSAGSDVIELKEALIDALGQAQEKKLFDFNETLEVIKEVMELPDSIPEGGLSEDQLPNLKEALAKFG